MMILSSIDSNYTNNKLLRTFNFHNILFQMPQMGFYNVREKVGSLGLFFGDYKADTSDFPGRPGGPLRCYQDNEITYTHDAERWPTCDYFNSISSQQLHRLINVYFDSQNYVNINSEHPIESYSIYNVAGEKVKSGKGITSHHKIPFIAYPEGIYLVQVEMEGKYYSKQLMKF